MSHEKKMKELMGRLVSMSPEPPPYPEETIMAHREPTRRPRPVLAFLGAAAVVALLAIPVILLTGGEEPEVVAPTSTTVVPETSTTVSPESTTTVEQTTTTVPESTSSTAATLPVWSQPVFVYQNPENSFTGNPALVPIWVEVAAPGLTEDSLFTAALAAVGDALPDGFENAIPPDVEIVGLSTANIGGTDVWVADMNQAFLEGAGGLLADTTMLNQMIYTLTASSPVSGVLFTVDGEPVVAFGSEGLDLSAPVDRDTFIDSLNIIFLTEPILETENVYVVSGRANTFEATLTVQVLDQDGAVVLDDFTTATCGTGCWGEFGVGVDSDLVVPGESSIRLLTYSAEDGSISHAITVPVPEGGVWELGPED